MANVTYIGFKEFKAKLESLPQEVQDQAEGFVEDAALKWAQLAKNDAPVGDTGYLQKYITAHPLAPMSWEVNSAMNYSPYVEWGTGTRVSVPSVLSTYAAQFKGKKRTIGRYPRPFFFIQVPLVEKELYDNIKKMLTTEK